MVQDNGEDIIELTQVMPEDTSGDQDIIELTDINAGDNDAVASVDEPGDGDDNAQDDTILDLGEPIPDEPEPESDPSALTDISHEALEAALERVIERKFSETIEKILFEVMEKVIQKEIADIKASLQKDLDEIGNA